MNSGINLDKAVLIPKRLNTEIIIIKLIAVVTNPYSSTGRFLASTNQNKKDKKVIKIQSKNK